MPDIKDDEKSDLHARDAREKGGHARSMPGDMTGQRPESPVFTGQLAPKLAGDRAKATAIIDRVKHFVEEYADLAFERTSKGEVRLPKEKVLALIDKLPTMPSSQMQNAVRAIGNYVWRVHAGFREIARGNEQAITQKMADMPRDDRREAMKNLQDTIDNFETASVQIKGDLNLLNAAAGELKRSAGGGSKADKTFLQKKGGGWGKPPDVKVSQPTVKLPADLAAASNYEPEPSEFEKEPAKEPGQRRSRKSGGEPVKARPPTIRRKVEPMPTSSKEMPDDLARELGIKDSIIRPFDRWINEVIRLAGSDHNPQWWEEM
jgi:hypothetical protein